MSLAYSHRQKEPITRETLLTALDVNVAHKYYFTTGTTDFQSLLQRGITTVGQFSDLWLKDGSERENAEHFRGLGKTSLNRLDKFAIEIRALFPKEEVTTLAQSEVDRYLPKYAAWTLNFSNKSNIGYVNALDSAATASLVRTR